MLKKLEKSTAILLTVLMIVNIFAAIPVLASTPETIAAWDYTAVPTSASVPATSGKNMTGAVLTNFNAITPSYSTTSLSVSGWDNGAGTKYWQISLSSKGYENLSISAKTRSSGTGPRDFKLVYSIDNGNVWKDAPNNTYAVTGTALGFFMPAVTLPADAANADSLQIRFIMTSNISSRAGTGTYSPTETVVSGGTSNINNIVVSGTPAAPAEAVAAVTALPNGGAVAVGSKVALSCATDEATIMYSVNDSAYTQYDSTSQITLNTLPSTIKAFAKKTGIADSGISTFNYTKVSELDETMPAISNLVPAPSTCYKSGSRPEISAEISDASGIDMTSIKLLVDGTDVTSFSTVTPVGVQYVPSTVTTAGVRYIPDAGLSDGKHTARVEAADIFKNKAVTEWDFTIGEPVYNLYFGQLHSHTNNSDGMGSLDDAFSHAKGAAKLDYFAVTDHSNSFDNAATESITNGSTSLKWQNGRAAADRYTTPGSLFVGIYGYEMTWSDGTGHINTFNTPGFETRENPIYKAADGLKKYYSVLKTVTTSASSVTSSISQFNHPGTTFGDFNDFANYDPEIDKKITLIEVGNGEGQVRGNGYFASYEYYTRALDKGWHLAPSNNQDNHLGNWGDSNTARTVLLADSLTRDKIYDAMQNRRAYATEDNNLRIKYTLNGNVMGTILDQKPENVDIRVDVEDPDNEAPGTISVISNGGRVVASKALSTGKDQVEFLLPAAYSYYYIRIDQADRDIAVTAPVWIGEVDRAGIAKTTGSTALPIKGETFTVTSSLFNNENVPMNITGLEYSINGSVVNTAPVLGSIPALGTGSYSFDYTPPSAGKYDMNVKLSAAINGVNKTFTDVLKLNVADPAIITKVVVDASHYNDYVAGYYSGNMTNLVTLANGEDINVVIQKDKLTDEALKNAKLLVLSPPAKKSGTANGTAYPAAPYTDEDIAVIRNFAENGGNIIITALADYQDSRTDTSNHSAFQQNRILEAIGAGTRINDDEVVDYDNNVNVSPAGIAGGTPYRIPMNVYDMTSSYLNGVVPAQNYSFYSGCSITPGNNATWLVKGTPTTYGFDSDNDKLGGSYVAAANKTIPADTGIGKGNVVALAAETLSGGGKLFVGGTVFYSNFEIKTQLDNSTQLQNSNYNITMNILDSIKKIIPVTHINLVRAGNIGDVFCAEGTVTAGTTAGNAFFDTIYIQDATGGINIFPVSGMDIKVGQEVKVTGTLDEYQGDKELRAIPDSIIITDNNQEPLAPKVFSTGDSMLAANEGWLMKTIGRVTNITGSSLFIDDGTGAARIFVDGYISDGTNNPDMLGKWDKNIKAGDLVSAIGLASRDTNGNRLRVRNTAEIVRLTVDVAGVTLDKNSIVLDAGGAQQLTAAVLPENATNRDLVWTSGNEEVAMVDNGLVTGIGSGSTDITVTTADGGFSVVCKVTVVVPASGVKLTKENTTIKVGESENLTAVISPENATNKKLSWLSSDPSVATVTDGTVKGLKLGTTTIAVKTEDGGFSSSCTVLVVKIPVTGVKILNAKETLKVGKSVQLKAQVSPSNATVKNAYWTSSNASVATVKDGLVKGLQIGTVEITVITEDGKYKDTCIIHIGAK